MPTSFMKPAEMTRSGRCSATDAVSARSQSARSVKSLTRCTNVGSPARSARASPSMPSRSAPTATTVAPYAGSAAASSSAWRLVPVPETRTTRRAGAASDEGIGTDRESRARRRRRRPGPAWPGWPRVRVARRVTPSAVVGVVWQPFRVTRRGIRGSGSGSRRRRCQKVAIRPPMRPPTPKAVTACTRTAPASGPTSVIRPGPTAPPASSARRPNRRPASIPPPQPCRAPSSQRYVGWWRCALIAPSAATRGGTPMRAEVQPGVGPVSGSAASSGNIGSAPTVTTAGTRSCWCRR